MDSLASGLVLVSQFFTLGFMVYIAVASLEGYLPLKSKKHVFVTVFRPKVIFSVMGNPKKEISGLHARWSIHARFFLYVIGPPRATVLLKVAYHESRCFVRTSHLFNKREDK
ncbi:hypothetical protein LSM04_006752 [Trypanosoma melophagium]|uniref:uncharacterized protein n=1 Tax=Trypanosoma melophagium TaxID=715481 RepID=UPI00351A3AAF|nr:hypothetical protein LSM04_006752 [Trypanosoma melophagium]